MANWQITTATIYCDAVDDEATVLVYGNGTIKCIGYSKYGNPGHYIAKLLKKKGKKLNRTLECDGPECHRATSYRDKLFAEDSKK
ncbi:MAG: hypothetical protein ABH934_03280 [Chloroflexota bacterium]